MIASQSKLLDYTFEHGKFNDLERKVDSNNILPKLNAMINIIHMRPGTLQDTPECGLDLTGLLFSEGDEAEETKTNIQNALYAQCARYIEPGFLEYVNFKITRNGNTSTDGSQLIDMNIKLKNSIGIVVNSENTKGGLIFKSIKFDDQSFE